MLPGRTRLAFGDTRMRYEYVSNLSTGCHLIIIVVHHDGYRVTTRYASWPGRHPKDTIAPVVYLYRLPIDILDEMYPTGRLPRADLVANDIRRLEETTVGRKRVATLVSDHHVSRARGAIFLRGLRATFDYAEMLQDIVDAAPANTHALDIHTTPAAEFGSKRNGTPAFDARGEGRSFIHAPKNCIERRAEG